MSQIQYYILDTETTGLRAGWHEIIQISIIRVSDKFQKTLNIKAEHPNRASPDALKIQNKTIYDLYQGDSKINAINDVDKFLTEDGKTSEHRCIVAHNYSFDKRFIHSMWDSVGKEFQASLWMCTREFTKKYASKQGLEKIAKIQNADKAKFDLNNCLVALGLQPKAGAHNAVIDTINTHMLWEKLMDQNLGHVSLIKRLPHGGQ